jgi:sugar O-acyltransferase (sialic acid O-acetyltransferase NeuD family)
MWSPSLSGSIDMPFRVVIVGAGGHAQVIADLIQERRNLGEGIELLGFLDDDPAAPINSFTLAPRIGSLDSLERLECDGVVIGIGDNRMREKLFARAKGFGHRMITLVHPRAVVSSLARIGEGTVLFGGTVVNTGAVIGDNVIINTGATVDHHNHIEAHVHVAPGVHLGGTVTVKRGAFLGIGAVVLPNTTIGEWSVVGAGAVVTKDLASYVTAVGVPAKVIREQMESMPDAGDPRRQRVYRSDTLSQQKAEIVLNAHQHRHNQRANDTNIRRAFAGGSGLRILGVSSQTEWTDVLQRCYQHDFYFLPSYNSLEEARQGGKAELWVYEEGDFLIALPLLFRNVDGRRLSNSDTVAWRDCSSVYGYSGPLASSPYTPHEVVCNWQRTITEALRARLVITVFARLHPLIAQKQLLAEFGRTVFSGRTISIDLTLSEENQISQYARTHALRIKSLKRKGVEFFVDENWDHIDDFIGIYQETMRRVHAPSDYWFSPDYIAGLKHLGGGYGHLCFCSRESNIVAGGIFIECDGIMEYHLSGTPNQWMSLSPMRLLVEGARNLGTKRGLSFLHLGGGVGSAEDSLFHFKAGFSDQRHEFLTWRWIVDPERYRLLCGDNTALGASNGVDNPTHGFFPAYRNTTV